MHFLCLVPEIYAVAKICPKQLERSSHVAPKRIKKAVRKATRHDASREYE